MQFIENSRLELKEIINSDFKKEIIAFANTDGGEIFVGVNKNGEVTGIANPEHEMEKISSMIHEGIHPDLIPFTDVSSLVIDGKAVIRVVVSRGEKPPYHLTDKGLKPSGVYVRHGVVSVPASEERIREMIRQTDGTTYDKARSLNQDLTFTYAEEYFSARNVAFRFENQRTLGLIDSDGYYTNTALLLSDQCEHSIKCAVFSGEGKSVFKTRKEFFGSVLRQLEEVYEYISLQNNVHADFSGLSRIECFDYPEYAIREALVNTIVHRDYAYSGSTIINIFTNRMEFVSLGGLVSGITLEDIFRGVSQSRNMVLANIFYRLKLIEGYGTGIQRILESYNDSAEPQFLPGNASFVTVLPNVGVKNTYVTIHDFVSPEEKVLSLLSKKFEISRRDVEEILGTSSFPARKVLSSLISKNRIQAIGRGKNTRYVLKKDD